MNKVALMTTTTNTISHPEEAGIAGVAINSYVKAIKSFGRLNGTKLDERLSVPDSEPRYAEEVATKPKEVQALFAWGALWYLSSCRISLRFRSTNY